MTVWQIVPFIRDLRATRTFRDKADTSFHKVAQAVLLAVSAAFVSAAAAQEDKTASEAKPAAQAGGWTVQCKTAGDKMVCRAELTVAHKSANKRLISVTVSRAPEDKATALFQLPHGLFLPAGLKTQVDAGKTRNLPIQTCDTGGCYAGTAWTKQEIDALKKGKLLKVTLQDLKKKNITIELPLTGFATAYEKL